MVRDQRIAELKREGWTVHLLKGGWEARHPVGKCKLYPSEGQGPWLASELAWDALIAVLDNVKAKTD